MLGLSGARAVILGISLVTMAVAWMLIGPAPAPTPAPIIQQQAAPQARTTEVLVAARELPIGTLLAQADVRWVAWPTDSIPAEMIRAGAGVTIEKDIVGSLVRSSFVNGEPLRAEKLIRPDGSGYLSAILPSGKRAVAIVIDRTGSSTAGGFVLPNDRVDVIKISRQDGQRESYISETILHNIRVLAIGTKLEERGPDKVVTAETATLELDARQVETVALAQRSGTITLALRSLADANEERPPSAEQPSLTVVRFGVSTQSPR
jgi:pilus assembly protein CpaB